MAGLSTGAGAPGAGASVVKVYHDKSMILPDVSRVVACLYEKDVKFERVKDSYKDILRLQASRSVPVPFYDGPTFLKESRAICRYIAETYKQRGYPFLLGKDVLERATIEQWLRHEEHAFNPPSRALFCHLAFPSHDEDNDDINREKRKLEEVLEVYEQRLGESEFLAGKKFTLADLVHLPNTHHIVTSEKFAYLYDSRKNVQRWWNTISARDSWQQVLRDMKSVEEQYQMEEQQAPHDDRGATEPQKTPSIIVQEPGPPVPSQPPTTSTLDELPRTEGVDGKAPLSTPKQTPTDGRNSLAQVQEAVPGGDDISDEQSDKITTDETAQQGMTPRQAPPSDTPRTSASIQEAILGARGPSDDMLGKASGTDQIATPAAPTQTPTQEGVPDVHDAGAPAAGPSPMKSQKNMNEASIQQLSSDQSRAQPAENKKNQGDDATLLTEIDKTKEEDLLANDKQKSTGQAQATSTDGPSKLQMQSDQNKPISSTDIVKQANETSRYRSSALPREMSPSVPEESMREQQLQGDRSSISPQDNVRQGSEAALPVSGTEQPKKSNNLTNADQNSGKTSGEALRKSDERTSSETPQVERNTSNSKSDGSSNPTQFDGNEGNLPEAQSRGSSTNP